MIIRENKFQFQASITVLTRRFLAPVSEVVFRVINVVRWGRETNTLFVEEPLPDFSATLEAVSKVLQEAGYTLPLVLHPRSIAGSSLPLIITPMRRFGSSLEEDRENQNNESVRLAGALCKALEGACQGELPFHSAKVCVRRN